MSTVTRTERITWDCPHCERTNATDYVYCFRATLSEKCNTPGCPTRIAFKRDGSTWLLKHVPTETLAERLSRRELARLDSVAKRVLKRAERDEARFNSYMTKMYNWLPET